MSLRRHSTTGTPHHHEYVGGRCIWCGVANNAPPSYRPPVHRTIVLCPSCKRIACACTISPQPKIVYRVEDFG